MDDFIVNYVEGGDQYRVLDTENNYAKLQWYNYLDYSPPRWQTIGSGYGVMKLAYALRDAKPILCVELHPDTGDWSKVTL